MVAIRLDACASHIAGDFKAGLREASQSTIMAERAFSVDGSWSSAEPWLGQRATSETYGGEARPSEALKIASSVYSTPPSISRPPPFDLRVLPPRHLRVNPDALQMPGSYRSEVSRNGNGLLESNMMHHEDDHQGHDHGLDLHDSLGAMVKPSSNKVAALDELKKYNVHPLRVPNKAVRDNFQENSGNQADLEPPHLVPFRSSSLSTARSDTVNDSESRPTHLLSGVQASTAQMQADEQAHLSPVSGAPSMLSELSSRSGLRRGSSISATTNQSRASVIRPSEVQHFAASSSAASANHAENRKNEQRLRPAQQRREKRAATIGPSSNLTARPNHQQNHAIIEGGQLRSSSMPSSNVGKSARNKSRTENTDEASSTQRQQIETQSFSKAIGDLENLLQEALTIAGKAASRETSEADPNLPEGGRHKQANEEVNQLQPTETDVDSGSESSYSSITDEEDHPKSRRSVHVTIDKLDTDIGHKGQFKKIRDATPYPKGSVTTTRHQSAVSPIDHFSPDENEVVEETSQIHAPSRKQTFDHAHALQADHSQLFQSKDWAYDWKPGSIPLPVPDKTSATQAALKEDGRFKARNEGMRAQQRPPVIQPRTSSNRLQGRRVPTKEELNLPDNIVSSGGSESDGLPYIADYKTSALQYHPVIREAIGGDGGNGAGPYPLRPREDTIRSLRDKEILTHSAAPKKRSPQPNDYDLKDRHHFSIREPKGFSLSRSHRRKPIARDWSTGRKRLVAAVTCITTALMGLILGIYAGEVPALQYALADEHHYTILGNVVFFLGLSVTTSLLWPLPLLHGRKPYILAALIILLPLQFPQGLAVNNPRSPYVPSYKVGVLLPRAVSGLVMGLANINFLTTLLDLFGASLQSGNPHQEYVNENDVRRHGGGIGAWLGIWTWCSVMSIGLGFLIGASVISSLNVSWGFWITIVLNATVLLINVMIPEVRRSPYRRSMAEVRTGTDISRRIARGEIKMHLESTGPKHWYEEVTAGYVLAFRMLKQPGFLILALYQGWIYGQIVMVIVLLGALLSKYYHFHPQYVGLGVAIVPLAALLAVPFQKANIFSRARHHRQRTDSMTFEKRVTWTSHLVRRTIFMIILPFAGLAYTLASNGSVHYIAPIIFAGLIGFLSNLAIAECNGLIMETFDTSDLQPGMTGRPRRVLPEEVRKKRTNFSCFPRVTAGFAVAQTFAFLIAAGATGWGGVIERHLGAQTATAVVAGILLILTLLLIAVLWRFKVVQVVPLERFGTNILSGPEDEWKPIIIGNPSGTTRRMNALELGKLSRWSEIRRRNRLGSI